MDKQRADRNTLSQSLTRQMASLFLGRVFGFVFALSIPVILVRTFSVEQFGLYKLVFLVFSTLLVLLRFGLEPSLYYFIPRDEKVKNIYISQTIIFYVCIGVGLFLLSYPVRGMVGYLVNNPAVADLFPLLTFYTALMLVSIPMETIMISLKQAKEASLVIVCTELLKALLIIGAAIIFKTVSSLIYALSLLAGLRVISLLTYLFKRVRFSFNRVQAVYVRTQITYSTPLFLAAMSRSFSDTIHYYMVSYFLNVRLFAVYSVGFLQLPLISIFFDSIVEPSIVRLSEFAKKKDTDSMGFIITDVIKKISLIFFPACCFLLINAKEFIVTLYTVSFL